MISKILARLKALGSAIVSFVQRQPAVTALILNLAVAQLAIHGFHPSAATEAWINGVLAALGVVIVWPQVTPNVKLPGRA